MDHLLSILGSGSTSSNVNFKNDNLSASTIFFVYLDVSTKSSSSSFPLSTKLNHYNKLFPSVKKKIIITPTTEGARTSNLVRAYIVSAPYRLPTKLNFASSFRPRRGQTNVTRPYVETAYQKIHKNAIARLRYARSFLIVAVQQPIAFALRPTPVVII